MDPSLEIGELIAEVHPLTARSVLASTLLGARDARLPVSNLVQAGALFGISSGAVRTCLWRMVSNGELVSENGTYRLTGRLAERKLDVDDATNARQVLDREWDGTWELAIVVPGARSAVERYELRAAARALHLAELREGVWGRPANLRHDRHAARRAVLARQCTLFDGARPETDHAGVADLFGLVEWSTTASRLNAVMQRADAGTHEARLDPVTTFLVSVAVVRHLQRDPLLPSPLLPQDWPGTRLRDTYRAFDRDLQGYLTAAASAR